MDSPATLLASLLETNAYSDLVLRCQDRELKVHSAVVCTQSPVFKVALASGLREATTGIYTIEEYDAEAVAHMVNFLYSGKYPDPDGRAAKELVDAEAGPKPAAPVPALGPTAKGDAEGKTNMTGEPEKEDNDNTPRVNYLEQIKQHANVNSIAGYFQIDKLGQLTRRRMRSDLGLWETADIACEAERDAAYARIRKREWSQSSATDDSGDSDGFDGSDDSDKSDESDESGGSGGLDASGGPSESGESSNPSQSSGSSDDSNHSPPEGSETAEPPMPEVEGVRFGDGLIDVINYVVGVTGDRIMVDVMARAAAGGLERLVSDGAFASLDEIPGFCFAMLRHANQMQLRTKRRHARQLGSLESQLDEKIRGEVAEEHDALKDTASWTMKTIATLNKTDQCKHCRCEFNGVVDCEEKLLRCRNYRTRHWQ
jgi:hypothetical protein